jgi:hypothetical protein
MTIFQRRKDRSSDRHKVIATVLVYEASERCQGGMTRSCARGEGFDVIVSRPNSTPSSLGTRSALAFSSSLLALNRYPDPSERRHILVLYY